MNIKKENNNEVKEFKDLEELKNAFYDYLKNKIRNDFIGNNNRMIEVGRTNAMPLLSCFVNDCLERGVDIENGGARYNWIMPSFVGLSNLADSLMVIDELIFKSKKLSFAEFAEILESDFKSEKGTEIRAFILNKARKYGNDIDEADDLIIELTKKITDFCDGDFDGSGNKKSFINCRGGRLIPSLFCWIQHDEFGRKTMASPDGRLAGFPLGDGSGPAQGAEKNGPTASILSSTKWEHHKFIGGIAVNIKFAKKNFNDESREKLLALIKTFMQRGGFELQVNVVDTAILEKARENPDNYRDLVVRIGGYSDYFTRLSKSMQAELIYRSEHEI